MKTALARKLDSESPDMEPAQEKQLLIQVTELRSDVHHLQGDVAEKFEKVEQKFKDIETKSEEKFKAIDARFNEVIGLIYGTRDLISSAKLWAYGLYLALAGSLLYIIARSEKWL